MNNILYVCGYIYLAFVGCCGIRGMYQGCKIWHTWHNTRTSQTINNEILDPIYNLCRDTSYLGFWVITGTFSSTVVSALSPISIPLLSLKAKDKTE